jgi:hypothetical protein
LWFSLKASISPRRTGLEEPVLDIEANKHLPE